MSPGPGHQEFNFQAVEHDNHVRFLLVVWFDQNTGAMTGRDLLRLVLQSLERMLCVLCDKKVWIPSESERLVWIKRDPSVGA